LVFSFIGIIQGSNVEFNLFGDLFRFRIERTPASPENIAIQIDKENEEMIIKNTSKEEIDFSNMSMNIGNEIEINFANLADTLLEPGETIKMNETDIRKMTESSLTEKRKNPWWSLMQTNPSIMREESINDSEENVDVDTNEEINSKNIFNQIWEKNISVTTEIIENGRKVIGNIQAITKEKTGNFIEE
jgi:hypothetical protein